MLPTHIRFTKYVNVSHAAEIVIHSHHCEVGVCDRDSVSGGIVCLYNFQLRSIVQCMMFYGNASVAQNKQLVT